MKPTNLVNLGIMVFLGLLLGACPPPWVYVHEENKQQDMTRRLTVEYPPFDESQYAPYRRAGTAVVEGHAVYRQRRRELAAMPGTKVTLDPVTSYSRFWWTEGSARVVRAEDRAPIPPPDPRFLSYRREAKIDGEGRFRFENLPAGRYFVEAMVGARTESGEVRVVQGGVQKSAGTLSYPYDPSALPTGQEIVVGEGETIQVLLCNGDQARFCPEKPRP